MLEQGQHRLHRSVPLFTTPSSPWIPFSASIPWTRGNPRWHLEHSLAALQDYQQALKLCSPFPELFLKRTLLLMDMGRTDEALADYNTILELDPDYLDALINRASLLYKQEAYQVARSDSERGLLRQAGQAQLLCLLGLVAIAEEQPEEEDPLLSAAWTNQAEFAFEQGQVEAAIEGLSRALVQGYDRGIAYQARCQWKHAIEDFTMALDLGREDERDLLYRRRCCLVHPGHTQRARPTGRNCASLIHRC